MTTTEANTTFFVNEKKEDCYAEVLVPLALPKNYTWRIPAHLLHGALPGVRVEVQLRNKKYTGIIKKLCHTKPDVEPRDILNVLDDVPIVYETQLQLWHWIAQYYLCSEGEVMDAAVPANLKLSGESVLIWNPYSKINKDALSDEEYIVAEALAIKKELRLHEVQQLLDVANTYPVVKKLIDKQICFINESLKEKFKHKVETFITLSLLYTDETQITALLQNWKGATKQMELIVSYLHLSRTNIEVTQAELLKKSGATAVQLKALLDKGILVATKKIASRISTPIAKPSLQFDLSPAQQKALDEVVTIFEEKNVCLLHGVTGSGKTQIYVKLIAKYLEQGKQVLYMLPEIALTAQIIYRLQIHFGEQIGIYHSKFNANERVEIWRKIKTGETKILLGARSALLLPFKNLGLIIVDEEHDGSYKQQDPAPRYNARDVSIYYAALLKAKVLLGSATPSVESYYNCETKKYGLVQLKERFGNIALPTIELINSAVNIDNTSQEKPKDKIVFTPQLIEAIQNCLNEKKQVILFQNKRGYVPYLICSTCGWIPKCEHCNVTLTYHKTQNKLVCHYCGSLYAVQTSCKICGKFPLKQKNFGTEKIEELITELFPDARTARMDFDAIKGKHDHNKLIKLFESKQIDILVGTQMVVKGLDFEHVNLVGVLDADAILGFTDFRVNERAFQLMEQVSGRAGRKNEGSKVLIQTTNLTHPILELVQIHNYEKFYEQEIIARKDYNYPPFCRVFVLVVKHKDKNVAENAAQDLSKLLRKKYASCVNGPAKPNVDRVRNQYLWEIFLKLPKNARVAYLFKLEIQNYITLLMNEPKYRSVRVVQNVDPL